VFILHNPDGSATNRESCPIADCSKLQPGACHTTCTGSCIMQNQQGSLVIGGGEFAYVKDANTPPVKLQTDPTGGSLKDLASIVVGNKFTQGADCVVK